MELLRRECLAISLMKKPEYPINIILQSNKFIKIVYKAPELRISIIKLFKCMQIYHPNEDHLSASIITIIVYTNPEIP